MVGRRADVELHRVLDGMFEPLASAQREIWLAGRAAPDGHAFWIAEYIDVAGGIDAAMLEDALRQALTEADGLGATFTVSERGPAQRQGGLSPDWRLERLDLSNRADPRLAAEAWMQADVRRPDAAQSDTTRIATSGGELFHHALLKLAPDRFFVYHRYHHIVADGFAARLIAARAAALYTRRLDPAARGRRGARRFGRFAALLAADQAYEGSADHEADRRFWRGAMAGWAGPALVAGRAAPATEQSLARRLALDPATAAGLRETAAAHGVAFADFLIALVAIWANVLTGERDLAVGLTRLGRSPGSELARVPATAANTLPVRLSLQAGMTAIDLARAAASFRRNAGPHGRYRGERLARELTEGAAGVFGPVLNIMSFRYAIDFGPHRGVARNVSIGPVEDLCVAVYDRRDGGVPDITLNANPALYDADRLGRMAARLEQLLSIATSAPLTPIENIDLLDPAERALLLRTRNQTVREIPFTSLSALFEWQASAAPNAPCLFADGETLTYRAVNSGADGLAGRLAANGVVQGDIVGVMLPRSAETVTLVLATMKIGAAFLLIDPALPAARVAAMIADARPMLVVTRRAAGALIPPGMATLFLDDAPAGASTPARPGRDVRPEDLAYVIFTSGTTGRPKPVAVAHRGLGSLAASLTESLWIEQKSRILQFSPLGFDALIMELCMAFAVGACLYLPKEEERYGPPLGRFLDRHGVTHAVLTPTVLASLRAEAQVAPMTLIVGGEACSGALAESWSVDRLMVNAYGPAEATVVATMSGKLASGKLASGKLAGNDPPPIGLPILNARVYVLDAFGRLAPDGVAGELHIAGDGVALGYLGDPELTAERFLPCPFERQGGRMYRTGDRVRWLPSGGLAFLGRLDRQIKLRGFRIEPGEIEAALRRLPGVGDAHVTTRGAGAELRLAAYIVAAPGAAPDPEALRRGLADTLPLYMVPATITILDSLPLTPNGKVDVRALPPPGVVPSGRATPATALERALASLFAAALGRDDIGADDDFFSLGGDSLKATLLVMRIGEALGVDVTIAGLFTAPTVRALARLIGEPDPEIAAATAVILKLRGGAGPALFCVHPDHGVGWLYGALALALPEGSPVFAVQARGLAGAEPLPSSVEEMARDYAAEIRRRQPRGPYHVLGWAAGGMLAHAVAAALRAAGGEIGLLAAIDGYPSDIAATVPDMEPAAALESAAPDAAAREALRGELRRYLADAAIGEKSPAALLGDAVLSRMARVAANTGRILRGHALGVFEGDLLLFKPRGAGDADLTESWRPHIAGRITVVEAPFHRGAMPPPDAMATIGPVIAERSRSWGREADMAPPPAPKGAPITTDPETTPPDPAADAGPLSILMTNIALSGGSETEIMTADLARALRAKGHRVAIYTPEPGPLARETMARGVPVTDRIDRIGFTPDIIHGHHNGPTAVAMIRFSRTPALFVCHDSAQSFDAPLVADRIGAYVAIDGACVERLVVAGADEERIAAIPQPIDPSRFPLRERWNERPTSALAIVTADFPHLDRVREACRLEDVALEIVECDEAPGPDRSSALYAAADIVLAPLREALEAAATGAAAIVCGVDGFGGFLTPRELEDWPHTRLARRGLDEPATVAALRDAIRRYRRDDAMRVARMLRERVSPDRIAGAYERLYRDVLRTRRAAPRPPDDGPLAAMVAEFMPRLAGYAERAKALAAAERRRRELDEWLAVNARGEGADTEIAFNARALGRLLLGDGWHAAEDDRVWSGDAPAHLRLPAALLSRSGGQLVARCGYYFPPGGGPDADSRTVSVFAAGQKIAVWEFARTEFAGNRIHARALRIPGALARSGDSVRLAFRADRTQSPLEAGESDDPRQLGLALISVSAASVAG
jgi:enterobactin synthetase component F